MIDLVIPTIGRASLAVLLSAVARSSGPRPGTIVIVDDRPDRADGLELGTNDADFEARVRVVAGDARGPAAARNCGWRLSRATWIAFLDDDVIVDGDWLSDLESDLASLPADVAGSTGIVSVPQAVQRKPTDWERNVGSLATAQWITADCAYRRSELLAVGGFDERFPRAFREDADLALRIVARGKRIVRGSRSVTHPVRSAPWWISVRLQAGNADDALMSALHGPDWYERAGASRGEFAAHVLTVAAAVTACAAGVAWAAQTARFMWKRFAPGPRTLREAALLAATSVAIPFAAVFHRFRGQLIAARVVGNTARAPHPIASAVLFDRDGTLIVDVPYNRDPDRVEAMPGARVALDRLRGAGIQTAVVSNQSGIALGLMDRTDVDRVNERVEALLGPLGPMFVCEHAADDRCACRKPAPGLIEAAARALGVCPQDCVVIGDIAADLDAARAAGARSILVANNATLPKEIAAAPRVAFDLGEAVTAVLSGAV